MEGLFNPLSILLHTLNALLLFAAIYFLLFKPVKKFLDKRSEGIAQTLQNADDTLKKSEAEYALALEKNKGAQDEAGLILKTGAQQAKERAQSIIDDAKAQADQIIEAAKKEAQDILLNAREAMADEAAALSVDIAGKILSREIKLSEHKQMISEFLEKVG